MIILGVILYEVRPVFFLKRKEHMLIHNDFLFSLYFGDKRESFAPKLFYDIPTNQELLAQHQFKTVRQLMKPKSLIVLNQTHSVDGFFIEKQEDLIKFAPYVRDGDYLITRLSKIALGMATADCLPLVIFDPINKVIAVIHAGWRGSVNKIAQKALAHMTRVSGTQPESVKIFFGPCAKNCCYEIQEDCLRILDDQGFGNQVVIARHDAYFFDLPLYNKLLLEEVGVPASAFHMSYNACTICDENFCSYRRDRENAARQMTVVALK